MHNMTAIFNFLMIAGAVQGILFVVFTFFSRKKIERPVLFLNLFVLVLSFNNLQSWLIDKEFIGSHFTIPFYVLLAPLFHAFIIYYLGIEKKKSPFFKLAIFLFLFELVVRMVLLVQIKNGNWGATNISWYSNIEETITLVFSLFVFYKTWEIIYRFQKLYPSVLTFDDLKWIKRLLQIGGIILLLWAIAILLNLVSETIKAPYSFYPLRLATSVYIYFIGYQGFFRYVVLKDRIGLRNEIKKNKKVTKQFERANQEQLRSKTEKGANDFNEFDILVKTNQKYLDPYLSLEGMAEELEISTSSLSKIINTHGNSNFTDYINQLRVEEAKNLLGNDDFDAYTIVAIGLECGFNSKSTFYAAFKKYTGQTPTQYRNS